MTKQQLLNALEEGVKTEENAIPLYTKHIGSTLFLSGFDDDAQERIKHILEKLSIESAHHSMLYQKLIEKVRNEDKDVY